jgi:2'-5' RNA ligase
MRLFVGIGLADETRQILGRFVSTLRKTAPELRWSSPEQWHITLQFLGETQETQYSCVVRQLRAVEAKAVEISFALPGFFERAKVLHVGVSVSRTLLALHRQTEGALLPCGYEPEARDYSPHVTLARGKGRGISSEFKQLQQTIEKSSRIVFPSFVATEFLLYQSISEQPGSRYEVRERFRLM